MDVLDGFVPESEGQLEKVEVENVAASRVLRALWLKGLGLVKGSCIVLGS